MNLAAEQTIGLIITVSLYVVISASRLSLGYSEYSGCWLMVISIDKRAKELVLSLSYKFDVGV